MHWHGWSHVGSNLDRPPDDFRSYWCVCGLPGLQGSNQDEGGYFKSCKGYYKVIYPLGALESEPSDHPDYVQGMMLLNAIPDDWDHVAAYYVQTTTAIANVSFTAIRTAILAEHDRLGGTRQNQSHIEIGRAHV